MITEEMMYDDWVSTLPKEDQVNEDYNCMCGYPLRKESEYINNQGQLVSIMVCDSCGRVEPWVEDRNGFLETK